VLTTRLLPGKKELGSMYRYEGGEKKVEEMQHEVNKLKNQEKVKQIEDRIRQQQEEVRRLRRGY
jgi:TolA-binding protein